MEIRYEIDRSQRKELAHTIAELTGSPVSYLAAPSFAYQIGGFHLSKDAVLSFDDSMDGKLVDRVLGGLRKAGYSAEEEPDALTVTMPGSFFTEQALTNLRQLIENKGTLLRHALGTESLDIDETDKTVEFPWFTVTEEGDGDAYCQFISMLCKFAKKQKRVNSKPDTSDNEKYAFRCFLLRLGMIGADYKQARKVLLRNLTGSSAFRSGHRNEVNDDEVSE